MLKLYDKPTLTEILQVCHGLPEDEWDSYEAFNGAKYDPNTFAARLSLMTGPSWCIYDGNTPIAVGGFELVRRGVWQDWMVFTTAAWSPANWRGVTRYVRAAIEKMLETEAHRLQFISLRSKIHVHKWYRVLKLRQEGVLEAYGVDGEDALIFARTRDAQ